MERSDVFEIQDFWNTDEGQAGGKRRSNEIRRFFMLQVGSEPFVLSYFGFKIR